MVSIQYRFPPDDWADDNTVTEDQLFDGSTFDYCTLVIVDDPSYDYLLGIQLIRGEQLYDGHRAEDGSQGGILHVYIRVVGLP